MKISKKIAPDGYAHLTPFLNVTDPERALSFYESAFGCERSNVNEQDGTIVHAEVRYRGEITFLICPEGAHNPDEKSPATSGAPSPIKLLLYVEDVDAIHKKAISQGAKNRKDPADVPWGERYAFILDPDGYTWQLAASL